MAGEKIKAILKKDSPYLILFFVILAAVTAAKIYVISTYGARWWADSFDYFYYAEKILTGDFFSPEAKRAPGYPLFIAVSFLAFGIKNNSVAYLQVIFGFFSLYLFYVIQKELGIGNKLIILNLFIFLLGPLSYFELNVLTESFTVFSVLIFLRYVQRYLKSAHLVNSISPYSVGKVHNLTDNSNITADPKLPGKKLAKLKTVISINTVFSVLTAGLLVLTRPQFVFPLILICIYLFFRNHKTFALFLGIGIVLIVFSYSYSNYARSNYFGLSSYLGYNIINHTGDYIEEARELNPGLVDIYVTKREELKKKYNNHAFTIWSCLDQIYKKLDYDFLKTSRELTRISLYLIVTHPIKYLRSVSSAMFSTFVYTDEYIHEKYSVWLFSVVNMFIFIAGTLFLLIIKSNDLFINSVKLFFFVNIIFSGMLDKGENFRHILPLMFILITAFTTGIYLIRKKVVLEKLPEPTS